LKAEVTQLFIYESQVRLYNLTITNNVKVLMGFHYRLPMV